jgi:DNA-binding ferritin-like protein
VKKTRRTIDGRVDRYADWRKRLVELADAQAVTDRVRDQVTESMMEQAWADHETPEHFLATCVESFG